MYAIIILVIIILIVGYYWFVGSVGSGGSAKSSELVNKQNADEQFISPYSVVYNHRDHGPRDAHDSTSADNAHFDQYDDVHSVKYLPNTRYGGAWPYRNRRNMHYNRIQGRELVVINNGAQRSSYNIYDERQANMPGSWPGRKEILVRLHYTAWNPKSKFIWPIWQRLKRDLGERNMVLFEEIDEQVAKTDGINKLPMIIKYKDGVAYTYDGPPEYVRMREWIMSSTDARMYYFYPRRY